MTCLARAAIRWLAAPVLLPRWPRLLYATAYLLTAGYAAGYLAARLA